MSSTGDKKLSEAVLLMPRTPDGMSSVAKNLIGASEGDCDDGVIETFLEEMSRAVLDWMAAGQHDFVRAMLSRLHETTHQRDVAIEADRLSPRLRVYLYLRSTAHFLATFLRTDNLARDLSLVAGVRRRAWREALRFIYQRQRPVMRRELVESGVFESDKTAHSALKVLNRGGLVDRVPRDGNVFYDLSWTGRSIAQTLGAEKEHEPEEQFSVSFSMDQLGRNAVAARGQLALASVAN